MSPNARLQLSSCCYCRHFIILVVLLIYPFYYCPRFVIVTGLLFLLLLPPLCYCRPRELNLTGDSKRGGLDKAVYRIEQAIKKSKSHGNAPDDTEVNRLQALLNEAHGVISSQATEGALPELSMQDHGSRVTRHPGYRPESVRQTLPPMVAPATADDNYAVADAENPLQLLARASDISTPPFQQQSHSANSFMSSASTQLPDARWKEDLQAFFGPFRPSLDVGEDMDPIDLGLVTMEEADALFS